MKPISRHICKTCKVQFNLESSVCPSCEQDTENNTMAHYTKTTRELRDTAKMLASSPLAPMLNNAAVLIDELVADLDAEKEARRKPIEHLLAPWMEVHDDMKRALRAVWACWTNAGELSLAVELVRPHVKSKRIAAGTADEKPDGQAENVQVVAPATLEPESTSDVVAG